MTVLRDLSEAELSTLKDRTVIIMGGASGIGAAACTLAHAHGAKVVIADVQVELDHALQSMLGSRAIFHETDVSSWSAVLSLFETAYSQFGSIDVVCSNAGTPDALNDFFAEETDGEGKLKEPSMLPVDVNLKGAIYMAKAGILWFEKQRKDGKAKGKQFQIIITGSTAR